MGKEVVNQYQPSISEWFALISADKAAEAFRIEDNQKVERLEYLYQKIGLPYERPDKLDASELSDMSDRFKKILEERGEELCAIRLVPKKEGLPKIRNRGLSIKQCYEDWYLKQKINPEDYTAFICPHVVDVLWSFHMVVKKKMIFGEIIPGGPAQLSQGVTKSDPIDFQYDYSTWQWSVENSEAKQVIEKALKRLVVESAKTKKEMSDDLAVAFHKNYLLGYFEGGSWPGDEIVFIDFNRLLPSFIADPPPLLDSKGLLTGKIAYPGLAEGKVQIIDEANIDKIKFDDDMVLVCDNTDVRHLPFMKKARAIVTDRGGILSHAAIIARELKIPCLVDTKKATNILKNGQKIKTDCLKGEIHFI